MSTGDSPAPASLTLPEKMRVALGYVDMVWPQHFGILKRHVPGGGRYPITASIGRSPALQEAIVEIGEAYKAVMLQKAELRLQITALDTQCPGFMARLCSRDARGRQEAVNLARKPLEMAFGELQMALCRQNIAHFERLTTLVEASYDGPTREKLGDRVAAEAKKDAYTILSITIREIVETFDTAFRRFGVEFGVPRNLEDPRRAGR